jgi:hypothetical protein
LNATRKVFTRNYQIAGITIQVISDLPFTNNTFASKFDDFRVPTPGEDRIQLYHHFTLPDLSSLNLSQQRYRKKPWAIYQDNGNWIYLGISPKGTALNPWRLAIFNHDLTHGQIYSPDESNFLRGNLMSLTLFPTDQILLGPVLADRDGCFIHASGIIINDCGLLFIGHSGAGKSTIIQLLENEGIILCDDRVIVRRWPESFRVHGTWSHGDIPIVSNASAPLRAVFMLEQSTVNRLMPIEDRGMIVRSLPFFVIKPMVTADWWEKTLDLVGRIAREVPVYRLQFDRSGRVKDQIIKLVEQLEGM